ncbi:MAG TPA: sigma-54 dependent transcriptional regulator [Thermoanaerobaculia bacterium]
MARVALVEDDPNVRSLFVRLLESANLRPAVYDSGDAFLSSGEAGSYDVVVTDFQMPGASGLDVLRSCRAEPDPPEVLLVTGVGTIPNAVEAMRMGAFDYLAKPVPSRELIHRVGLALEARRLRHDVVALSGELRRQQGEPLLIGESRAIQRLLAHAQKAAETDSTVLILGETGAGKEVVARHIQKTGRRSRARFLTLNCATLPEDSIENELFGHAPGAFPGATEPKRGLFEEASGGTLLLDEVASLSSGAQAKLLRFLDEGTVRRVGENMQRSIDVRVLSTTNRNLSVSIAARVFREDLFYRLSVITLVVPPLRERREDIEPLALHFLEESVRRHGKERAFARQTLDRLAEYDFPGNVRELRYAIEQAVILSEESTLLPRDFPLCVPRVASTIALPAEGFRRKPSQEIDAEKLQEAIRQCHGNRLQAARRLGISRATLYRLLARTGSKPKDDPA